ncbi:NlpC/P60 family protein [Streptomyces sp. HSG2]|uniref:NlpC/P60 family protein n=1 Tax=Streptomyces sp. HSG2 TaxID=2797167 RepID=UPI001F5B7250|nr:NlpC/P60 family protein [Streptomyces sp. HSG2]
MASHRKSRPTGSRAAAARPPARAADGPASVALLSPSTSTAAPSDGGGPSLDEVERRVDALYRQAGARAGKPTRGERTARQRERVDSLRDEGRGARGARRGDPDGGGPSRGAGRTGEPASGASAATRSGTRPPTADMRPAGATDGGAAVAQGRSPAEPFGRPEVAGDASSSPGRRERSGESSDSPGDLRPAPRNDPHAAKARVGEQLAAARRMLADAARERSASNTTDAAPPSVTANPAGDGEPWAREERREWRGDEATSVDDVRATVVGGAGPDGFPEAPVPDTGALSREDATATSTRRTAPDPWEAAPEAWETTPGPGRDAGEATAETGPDPVEGPAPLGGRASETVPSGDSGYAPKGDKAVAFARAQIGKPYVWGATGPGSYDCSGLTRAAWTAAGVALPRSTRDQARAGTVVPLSEARPGDLVFFSDDPAHVGVHVGNGMMIHAPGPGSYVREDSVVLDGESTVRGVVRPA